ncbi:MAG: hypothetical protein MZV63_32880 [Marinilabiliales bacterium]|nr:hypothetical protein [Marinilabiliales bacterium]
MTELPRSDALATPFTYQDEGGNTYVDPQSKSYFLMTNPGTASVISFIVVRQQSAQNHTQQKSVLQNVSCLGASMGW